MFADKLDASRFFARIRSLDIECPKCGTVYHCTGSDPAFNRRSGRFQCQIARCGQVLTLGVLAYPPTRSSTRQHAIPGDWTPTPRQAAALRLFSGFWMRLRRNPDADRNVVLRNGCRCLLEGTEFRIHPQCTIHGAGSGAGEDAGEDSAGGE